MCRKDMQTVLWSGVLEMKSVIAGINHYDPLGRYKIEALLLELQSKGYYPDCIATEWDKYIAERVISQRQLFIDLAQKDSALQNLGKDIIIALSQTIAYEVDSHNKLYPSLPIIWLDEGRETDIELVDNFARYRVDRDHDFIQGFFNSEENDALRYISKAAWVATYGMIYMADTRDWKFSERIKEAITGGYNNIFIIVGEKHVDSKVEGNFYNLIKNDISEIEIYNFGEMI